MRSHPSVMQHRFSQVPQVKIPRSQFDRSHGLKTAFDAGFLVPIFLDEALPGDTFKVRATAFGRLATPIFPIMDNLYLDTFFFAVPYRLLWDNWAKFNGEQTNPGDSTDFTMPMIDAGVQYSPGSLGDFFGLPISPVPCPQHSALPFRAYKLIWNEWFRDQNLQQSIPVPKGDGPDTPYDTLLRRGKRHDYFTSCLPWPQKGPGVSLPIGNTAPVDIYSDGAFTLANASGANPQNFVSAGSPVNAWASSMGTPDSASMIYNSGLTGQVNLAEATSATINSLRQAFQIQRIYERDARGGTRYTEQIRSHFGVISPDFRLQRPEYLGGGSTRININPIAKTSSTDETAPQGNLAAMGTAVAHGHGFSMSFTEHCLVIGLACIRADLTYQQGLHRMWSRKTRFDFYWPSLAHIGEQAVLNKEIFATGTLSDDQVFGYQERYAEYRYKPSQITSVMRSTNPASLDAWHLSQEFTALPTLSAAFIEENPPIDRVIAVPSEPHFIVDIHFNFRAARPMPVYGVPGLIDHF